MTDTLQFRVARLDAGSFFSARRFTSSFRHVSQAIGHCTAAIDRPVVSAGYISLGRSSPLSRAMPEMTDKSASQQ